MRSRRLTSSLFAAAATLAAAALSHACSDDPAGPDGNLPVVSDLTVEPIGAGRMRLAWSPLEGAAGYDVERRRDLTGEFGPLAEVGASGAAGDSALSVTYIDTAIEPLTFYGYRVRTRGRLGGVSRPSAVAGARSAAPPGIELVVSMNAPDPSTADTDGFRVLLEGPQNASDVVAAGDTLLLSPLTPGDYTLTLEDVAATCSVTDGASRSVTVTNQGAQTVTSVALSVTCRDPSRGGIVVEAAVVGDTTDINGFAVRVVGANGEAFIEDHLEPGPGDTATSRNPDLLFLDPGEYEVQLRDVDTDACALDGSPDRTVEVTAPQNDTVRFALTCTRNQLPAADAGGPYTGKANTPVQFSAGGSSDPDGSIASYTWDFGDSGAGTGADPVHAYEAEGIFDVVLTVTDDRGGTDVDSAVVSVGPPNQPPTAALTGPSTGAAGAQLAFDARESSDPDGEIAAVAWSFGDGTSGSGDLVLKTFNASGTYTVAVTVTDNDGATDSDSMAVTVTDRPNQPPTADAGGPYNGVQGREIMFSGGASSDADGAIVRYEWQFGDGRTGRGSPVSHTYRAAGAYTVVLTVFDNQGAIGFDTASVHITTDPGGNQPPIAQANGPYSGAVKNPVLFNAGGSTDSDGQIVSYAWEFGDGTEGAGLTTSHIYASPGQYTLRLTVTDDQGSTGTDVSTVTIAGGVQRPPVANANGPYSGLINIPISFSAAGSFDPDGEIVRHAWSFGDGSAAVGPSVTHAYVGAGTYRVVLNVTDNLGAIRADTTEVEVASAPDNAPPVAEANGPYEAVDGTLISFSSAGSSDPDGTIVGFAWDFGDGAEGSGPAPTRTYAEPGTFNVTLTVTDDVGATATDQAQVTVTEPAPNDPPVAEANGPYEGTVGSPIGFTSAGSDDADGTIVEFAWDFGDGGSGMDPNPTHTYAEPGTFNVTLIVTDDRGASATDNAEVTVTSDAPPGQRGETGTIRGRWVDVSGAPVTQTTVGSTVFLEIDIEMEGNSNIFAWQAQLSQATPPLLTPTTQGSDLNCSNPGGQATCPSGAPPEGNTDVMDQYTGNNNVSGFPGAVQWLTYTLSTDGVGIQGLARLEYRAEQSGTVTLEPIVIVAVGDQSATDIAPGVAWNIPPLTITN